MGTENNVGAAPGTLGAVVGLVAVRPSPRFATHCRSFPDSVGRAFMFADSSGHCHGQYQIGNPVSPAPDGAIGAVQRDDGSWWWVVESNKELGTKTPEANR